MKTFFIFIISLLIICCEPDPPRNPDKKNDPAKVRVETVQETEFSQSLSLGGFLAAAAEYQQVSEVDGTLVKLSVRPGQKVRQGQQLGIIKPSGLGLDYQPYQVRALVDGTINNIDLTEGTRISKYQSLFTISKNQSYILNAPATLTDLLELEKKHVITVQLSPGLPSKMEIPGALAGYSQTPDKNTGLYQVKIKVACPKRDSVSCQRIIRKAGFAKAMIQSNFRKGLIVKNPHFLKKESSVFIVNKDLTIVKKKIKLGTKSSDGYEVIEGLKKGDQIISTYSRLPKTGERVVLDKPRKVKG